MALLTSFVVLSVILVAFNLSRPALSPSVADPALTPETNTISDSKYLGEGIILSLSVDKPSYGLNEDVTIEWSLTNNSSRTMVLSPGNVEFLIVDKNGRGIWASQDFLLIEHEVQEILSRPLILLDDLTLEPGQSWMGRRVMWEMTKQEVICTRGNGASFSCDVIDGQTVPPGEYELRFRPNVYYRISREGGEGFRHRGLPLSQPLRVIFEYRLDRQEAIEQESPGGPPPASILGNMVSLQEATLIAQASGFEARQPTQIPDGISLVGLCLLGKVFQMRTI